ncbi:SDR family oxidoreductase [Salibacterium qingdaonense]|uniref:NAD(P)-dependent dehydrogenase, short-chain alcohol dehydrogenase family n=1 Tax=Salibacterium qingdaonense TaxID=266892 RepID=A0A1I4N469_9BACI|nr:SDR family oxidoreductase [Salibacterium qingdaonense]SFM10040.1 NAD(P)-dependent dehydrogenase, short-chain alcohol dehydrogenase family [Salibacterium qingdaonense]
MNHETLNGKVAVVTGGGGVLCGKMAETLAAQGMKVVVLSRKEENAQKTVDQITEQGGEAVAFACDVTKKQNIEETNKKIQQHYDKYHVLINGAGGNHPEAKTTNEEFSMKDVEDAETSSFFDVTEEGLDHVFRVNFTGAVLATQVFLPHMIHDEQSTVINISSMSAPSPMTKVPGYSAAKAAVENFTQWFAVHMAKENIRCNAIAPGFFLTKQNYSLLMDENDQMTPRSQKIMNQTPMGRFGQPDDLSGTLLWLADPAYSTFITGVTVPVDGGFMAYSGV